MTRELSTTLHRIKFFGLGLVCAALLFSQKVPTFRTGVFLVHADAEVLREDKRPIAGLTQEDFKVLDGGQEQTIAAFSAGEQPLDAILLFDISGSMRRQVKRVAEVAHEGLRALRPGDRGCVMTFTMDRMWWLPFPTTLKWFSRQSTAYVSFDLVADPYPGWCL